MGSLGWLKLVMLRRPAESLCVVCSDAARWLLAPCRSHDSGILLTTNYELGRDSRPRDDLGREARPTEITTAELNFRLSK